MPASSDAPLAQFQSLRRSATLPSKLNPRKQRSSESLYSSEEHLFFHPCAKIVHFAPRALAPIPSSSAPSDFDYPVDTIETLPWRSPTERTVALAPLRLEKVQGLTIFLKCGSVVHAILKNSQCWCVDRESTFVLRIRPLTYYRIEIPNETEEDKKYVADLKTALSGILRYEVTPCPFKRGFTVEIPEDAKGRRRKKAWRPKERRESAPQGEGREETSDTPSTGEDTDGNTTDGGTFTPKGGSGGVLETIPDEAELSTPLDQPKDSHDSKHSDELKDCDEPKDRDDQKEPELSTDSVNELQPSFNTLLARFETNAEPNVDPDISFSSSVDSFHSVQSPMSPPLPSSPFSASTSPIEYSEDLKTESQQDQVRLSAGASTVSEVPSPSISREYFECKEIDNQSPSPSCPNPIEHPEVVKAGPQQSQAKVSARGNIVSEAPSRSIAKEYFECKEVGREASATPFPDDVVAETQPRSSLAVPVKPEAADSKPGDHGRNADTDAVAKSEMTVELRRRAKASMQRDMSPMPPPSALYHHPSDKQLSASFIQKTCTLVLIPPIQLFIVLLHIAARIVIGPALNSALGEFNTKFEQQRLTDGQETEDDFGLPLGSEISLRAKEARGPEKLDPWDLD